MKGIHTNAAILALLLIAASVSAATWDVATVHGERQFTISPDGTTLDYHMQPRTDYVWYENNGSAPGTVAQGTYGDRDGSRTFACTNVAAGQTISDLKLEFTYDNRLGYVTINYFMTDGAGQYGIFAPTSRGLGSIAQYSVNGDWTTMTIDLTDPTISDTAEVAVYEHNGFVDEYGDPYTTMTWGDIKNYTIAGMYDYQRSPSEGWAAWGTMWSQINEAGNASLVNGHGLALIWGDTVGNTTYATQQRTIKDVAVTFDGTTYAGTFQDATVPEPASMSLLGLGAVALIRRRK